MYAKITPVTFYPQQAVQITVPYVTVWPGNDAKYVVSFRDENDQELATQVVSMTGDAYLAWGSNDEYLYTYAAQVLNLTITEIVPGAPVAAPVTVAPANNLTTASVES